MNLEIFKNENFEIRVAVDEKGEPLFCLRDVCKILDLDNSRRAKMRLDEKGVTSSDTLTNGGIQKLDFINEPNLYRLIFQSRKPEAERFQDWVFNEVLPSIRKTGSYSLPKDLPTALRMYANEVEQKELALKQRDEAILTKAQIGNKREATAMATASKAVREVKKLQIQLDKSKEYASIKKVAKLTGINEKDIKYSELRKKSNELGLDRPKMPDSNYPNGIRTYHKDVWMAVYGVDITNLELKKGA